MTGPILQHGVVVVGAGQAASQLAASLRQFGYEGPLTLIGEEAELPYHRPPLSKTLLLHDAVDAPLLRPAAFYQKLRCTLRLGQRVQAIDRTTSQLVLADGTLLDYDHLVLATGARARVWPQPRPGSAPVFHLRTLADARALRDALRQRPRLAVLGAGYIGLEAAAAARMLAAEVTVLETASRVMARSVGEATSELVQRIHARQGVELRLSARADHIEAHRDGIAITEGGTTRRFDALLVGIGADPAIELATAAGLDCDRGVLVDAAGRSSDPRIFAIGDCTQSRDGAPRLESVQGAIDQAKAAAAALTGRAPPPVGVPWFWSDQYQHRLQVAGLRQGHDHVVVRRGSDASQSVWYLRGSRPVAVEAFDVPQDFMAAKLLIRDAAPLDAQRLADPQRSPQHAVIETPAATEAPLHS